jgi:4-alpha-glucanotransferase
MDLQNSIRVLNKLANLWGVQTVHYDISHQRRRASIETLLAVLTALGAPISSFRDIVPAWRERQLELWRRLLEPVVVAWEDKPPLITIRLPSNYADLSIDYCLLLENGEYIDGRCSLADMPVLATTKMEGQMHVARQFTLPNPLPWGYHRLILDLQEKKEETLIISAPFAAYAPESERRSWGLFVPLYALHSEKSWASGNFADLNALMAWAAKKGAGVIATLPLLAHFPDDRPVPSPYRPISRLMWSESYLDISSVTEMQDCPAAQDIEEETIRNPQPPTLEAILKLKRSTLRIHRVMAPQREILNRLSRGEFPIIGSEAQIYYRDIYDHLVRIEDLNQTTRDRADNALATYLSSVANRQNETMKVLSIVAAIFLPLTLVAGIYGMNFEYMPELMVPWAYFAVLGFMGIVIIGVIWWFWARNWLA